MLRTQLRRFSASHRRHYRPLYSQYRLYATSEPMKPSLQLVGELRKRTEVSISKAREALVATNNDPEKALEWVQNDLAISSAKKAAKVGGRETKEGLIAVSLLSPGYGEGIGGVRAAMIELNCETDFVGRNELFVNLSSDIAHSTAFLAEESSDFKQNLALLRPFPVDILLDAPLLRKDPSSLSPAIPTSSSVGSAIRDAIAKVGENITLRRAVSIVLSPPPPTVNAGLRVSSYVHGSTSNPLCGRMGGLVASLLESSRLKELFAQESFRNELAKLERALARQVVGFETHSIRSTKKGPDTTLYEQPFLLYPGEFAGQPVGSVLEAFAEQKGLIDQSVKDQYQGVAVVEFAKWSVGEDESSEGLGACLAGEMEAGETKSDESS
ncbi:hypothetical protein ACEPAG_182 [Sanghuangporus baumii]